MTYHMQTHNANCRTLPISARSLASSASARGARRDDARGDLAQEVAVVRDGDDRALERAQRVLQHLLGRDVQVVGRLVQHEQRARAQHELGQRQPRLLAAAQHAHLRGARGSQARV